MADLWSDKTVFAHLGHFEAASVNYEVMADYMQPLPRAFTLKVTLRAFGVFLGDATVSPIADGAISLRLQAPLTGTVDGRVDNWGAIDQQGNPVLPTDTDWNTAAAIRFMITGLANVALPVTQLIGLVPGLGPILRAAASLLGSSVSVNIGHKTVAIPIHRDSSGKPVQP